MLMLSKNTQYERIITKDGFISYFFVKIRFSIIIYPKTDDKVFMCQELRSLSKKNRT